MLKLLKYPSLPILAIILFFFFFHTNPWSAFLCLKADLTNSIQISLARCLSLLRTVSFCVYQNLSFVFDLVSGPCLLFLPNPILLSHFRLKKKKKPAPWLFLAQRKLKYHVVFLILNCTSSNAIVAHFFIELNFWELKFFKLKF